MKCLDCQSFEKFNYINKSNKYYKIKHSRYGYCCLKKELIEVYNDNCEKIIIKTEGSLSNTAYCIYCRIFIRFYGRYLNNGIFYNKIPYCGIHAPKIYRKKSVDKIVEKPKIVILNNIESNSLHNQKITV